MLRMLAAWPSKLAGIFVAVVARRRAASALAPAGSHTLRPPRQPTTTDHAPTMAPLALHLFISREFWEVGDTHR